MPNTRRWIDLLLVVAGVVVAVRGWPQVGAPLVAVGAVMPLLIRFARSDQRGERLYRQVPADLAAAHRGLIAASPDRDTRRAADDALLEVAALLGGGPPRGGAQRRFVAARVEALCEITVALRERHDALDAARDEVEALAPTPADDLAPAATTASGPLVGLFVVVLFPAFMGWDAVRGTARLVVAFVDGVALRVRTTAGLLFRAGRALVRTVAKAFDAWAAIRDRVLASAREARHRVAAARLRLKLRLRRARHLA